MHDNVLVNSNTKLNGSNVKSKMMEMVNKAIYFTPNMGVVGLTDQTRSVLLLGK